MNSQQIFDTVAEHLLTQGEKALEEGGPVFINSNGLRCALGALISDRVKAPVATISSEVYKSMRPTDLSHVDSSMFLGGLQYIHDLNPPEDWRSRLEVFAREWNLSTDVLHRQKTVEEMVNELNLEEKTQKELSYA